MKKLKLSTLVLIMLITLTVLPSASHAESIPLYGYADVLVDAWYSGANPDFSQFYGSYDADDGFAGPAEATSPTVALGSDSRSCVSLPTGSYIIVGFTDNQIINAPNQDDLFIEESGAAGDQADIYVSSNFMTYTYIGRGNGGRTSSFDLEDIGFNKPVVAVKIVGLDNKGAWPGFDVCTVRGVTGSLTFAPLTGLDAWYSLGIDDPFSRDAWSYYADPVDSATGAHVIERNLLTVTGAQPINLGVQYSSLLLQEGPLGKGWSHNFEAHLEKLESGSVIVHWNANRQNRFINNGNDTFTPSERVVKFDELKKLADGSYTLTRKDQSVYVFDTNGKLTELQNGHGQKLVMGYDANGRLATVTEPISGRYVTLNYNDRGLISSVSDQLNRQTVLQYYPDRNLINKIINPKGQATTYTYNEKGQVLSAVDNEGIQIFKNEYDAKGRVAIQDDGSTVNQLAKFFYDETSEPGKVITKVYDRNGNIRVLTHDTKYQLLTVKDEHGKIINGNTYDDNGNRKGSTDVFGKVTSYGYDVRGNLNQITDPKKNISKLQYDNKDNLLVQENALGKKFTYVYDANNNPETVTDPLGNVTITDFDANGLLLTKVNPGSGITSYSYETGQVKTVTDAVYNTTTYGYDLVGRLTTITDSAGKTTTMFYDNADNLEWIQDPLGRRTTYTYDSSGNKLTETDPKGNSTTYTYNANGKLETATDALGNVTQYMYDGEDRLEYVIDARGNKTSYQYDLKGRLIKITDPLGNSTSMGYDDLDRLISKTDALGNKIETISYDVLGNPIKVTDAMGRTTTNSFDNINRLKQSVDSLGRITKYEYDDLNSLVTATDPLTGRSSQAFDKDGNLKSLVDPNNNQTILNYDLAGRLQTTTTAAGYDTTYHYNNRNLLSETINGRNQSIVYTYKDDGRLEGFTDPTGTVTYTYDVNGNIDTVTDSKGTISREYDKLDRVTSYTDSRGNKIRYHYDAVGNLDILTYPNGKQVQYGYDELNRLETVTDWAYRVTTYQYYPNGLLWKTTRPNGTTMTSEYNKAGQLVKQTDVDKNGTVISEYTFTYDNAGNVSAERTSNGGQPVVLPNSVMTYTKDNRLATFNGQTVAYDADGNMTQGPLAGAMADLTFDSRNRLTVAGNTTYEYDVENNRVSVAETVNGQVYKTDYVINPHAALSQVLVKTDNDGKKTYYVYGLGLLAQEDIQGNYLTYHFDSRGSTVALTDEAGTVTDTFQYSPFGSVVKKTGDNSTPFLYNGRDGVMTDSNGLLYMRARYYNPEIKRFINRDVVQGSIGEGQSLNRYAYVNGNPVSYVDPFGLARDGNQGRIFDFGKALENFLSALNTNYDDPRRRGDWETYYKDHPIGSWQHPFDDWFRVNTTYVDENGNLQEYKFGIITMPGRMGKTGPKPFGTGAHNQTIAEVADSITDGKIIAGGQKLPEKLIPTPGGFKSSRRPDILVEKADATMYGINVGKTTKAGAPIKREVEAIYDLEDFGLPMHFVPYK